LLSSKQQTIEYITRTAISIFMVVLVLAMYPHTADPTGHIKNLITTWFVFFLGSGWILSAWYYKFSLSRPRIFFDLWLCFLAFYLIATIRSPYPAYSFLELSWFGSLFVLYLVASQVYRNVAQVRRTVFWLCIAVSLSSLYGFLQMAGLDPFPWGDKESPIYTNLPATFGNPNYAAHTLILAIILAAFLICSWRRSYAAASVTDSEKSELTFAPDVSVDKVSGAESAEIPDADTKAVPAKSGCLGRMNWPILFLVLMMMHLYQTSQRAGMLALFGAFLLVLITLLVVRRFRSPAQGIVVSLLIIGVLGFLAIAGTMTRTYVKTGSPFPLDTSILIRYQSYVSATRMILDKPLFGHGPGVYAITYPEYWTQFEKEYFAQELRMNAHVHNDLLEIAVDAGLPAAGLFMAIIVLGLCYGLLLGLSGKATLHRYFGFTLAALFFAFFIDGMFGFNLRLPVSASILFLVMGFLEGIHSNHYVAIRQSLEAQRAVPRSTRLLWRFAAMGMLGFLLAFLVYNTRVFASEYALQQGLLAQSRNNAAQARVYYHEAGQLAPWNHYMPRRLALLYIQEGELDKAVTYLEEAIKRNPYYFLNHLPMAHTKLALAQQHMIRHPDDFEHALELLESAANHVQRIRDFCPMLSNVEELLGRIAFYSALCVESSTMSDRGPRARAYRQLADANYSRALELGTPNPDRLYLELAKLRMTLNDLDGAEEALVRAAQANPRNGGVWPQFLEFAHAHGRFDRMRNTLIGLIDVLRGQGTGATDALVTTHLWLAATLENGYEDQEDLIDTQYRHALRLQPDRLEIWSNYARFSRQHNRMSQFESHLLLTVSELESDGAPVPGVLAAISTVLRRGTDTLDRATQALMAQVRSHQPGSSMSVDDAYGWAAHWLLAAARNADALERGHTDSETEQHQLGGLCGAYMNLGIIYAVMGEFMLADQLYTAAWPCIDSPREAALGLHWADVLASLERQNDALDILKKVHAKHPDNLDVRWALARTYGILGMVDDARLEYQFLMESDVIDDMARQRLQREMSAL